VHVPLSCGSTGQLSQGVCKIGNRETINASAPEARPQSGRSGFQPRPSPKGEAKCGPRRALRALKGASAGKGSKRIPPCAAGPARNEVKRDKDAAKRSSFRHRLILYPTLPLNEPRATAVRDSVPKDGGTRDYSVGQKKRRKAWATRRRTGQPHCVGDVSEIKSLGHPPDQLTIASKASIALTHSVTRSVLICTCCPCTG
jgi:hypothetical protein